MPLEQLEDAKAWLISRKWSSGDKRFTSLFWIKFDDHSNEKKGKTSFWMSQDLQTFLNFVQISTLLSCPDQFMFFFMSLRGLFIITGGPCIFFSFTVLIVVAINKPILCTEGYPVRCVKGLG